MAGYLISYDLRKPEFDYNPLYIALYAIEAKHIQDSVWGVNTRSSAKVVFDYLWRHMHNEKDRLFVIAFDKAQADEAKNSITAPKDI
jgi:hypothetical protein